MHYTYWLEDSLGKSYIGCRTCLGSPYDDVNYMSSSADVKTAIFDGTVFTKTILAIWETRKDALMHEVLLHEIFDVAQNPKFYNKAKQKTHKFMFDSTGRKHSIGTKEKMSRAKQGEKNKNFGKRGSESTAFGHRHTDEQKDTMKNFKEKNGMFGKTHKPESISLMKENRPDISGVKNPFFGKKHTEESKRTGSKNHMFGIVASEHPGSKWCYTPLGKFSSVKEAAKAHNVSDETIRNRVKANKEGYKIEKKGNKNETI